MGGNSGPNSQPPITILIDIFNDHLDELDRYSSPRGCRRHQRSEDFYLLVTLLSCSKYGKNVVGDIWTEVMLIDTNRWPQFSNYLRGQAFKLHLIHCFPPFLLSITRNRWMVYVASARMRSRDWNQVQPFVCAASEMIPHPGRHHVRNGVGLFAALLAASLPCRLPAQSFSIGRAASGTAFLPCRSLLA